MRRRWRCWLHTDRARCHPAGATAKSCRNQAFQVSREYTYASNVTAAFSWSPGRMIHVQRNPDGSLTIRTEVEVEVPAGASMLDAEECRMAAVNKAGAGVTGCLLEARDTDGKPLTREGRTFTVRRKKEIRHVETPYDCAVVERWAYQSSPGGVYHYPLDRAASLIRAATPKFAQMVSRKLVEPTAGRQRANFSIVNARNCPPLKLSGICAPITPAASAWISCGASPDWWEPLPQPQCPSPKVPVCRRRKRWSQYRSVWTEPVCSWVHARRTPGRRTGARIACGSGGSPWSERSPCMMPPPEPLRMKFPKRRGRGLVVAGGVQSFEAR